MLIHSVHPLRGVARPAQCRYKKLPVTGKPLNGRYVLPSVTGAVDFTLTFLPFGYILMNVIDYTGLVIDYSVNRRVWQPGVWSERPTGGTYDWIQDRTRGYDDAWWSHHGLSR